MPLPTYTVFCCQADAQGTTHIDSVEAPDLTSAIQAGREQCLRDWTAGPTGTLTLEDIHCLGIAEGDVTILHWEDPSE
jgi:hypothetical protein